MYDFFASHRQASNGDRVALFAAEISHTLEGGLSCWSDQRLEGELNWYEMKQGIMNSKVFLLFCSDDYLDSFFCRREFRVALQLKKPIALLIDAIKLSIPLMKFLQKLYELICQDEIKDKEEATEIQQNISSWRQLINLVSCRKFIPELYTKEREEMINGLVNLCNSEPEQKKTKMCGERSPLIKISSSMYQIGIVGNAFDQMNLIAFLLTCSGYPAIVLKNESDVNSVTQNKEVFQSLIVYLTDQVFASNVVNESIIKTAFQAKKIVFMYEADPRREGFLKGSDGTFDFGRLRMQIENETLSKLLDLKECLPFAQGDRRDDMLKQRINVLINRCIHNYAKTSTTVLPKSTSCTLFNYPPSFSPFRRAKEKYDNFEEGTREWLVTEIIQASNQNSAIFLLSSAGMGKSTLFGSMAMRFCNQMRKYYDRQEIKNECLNIAAMHFFRYDDLDDKSIQFALKSISFQFCESIHGFSDCLAKDQQELDENLRKYNNNVKSLLNYLILEPARKLTEKGKNPKEKVTILLDALDECEDPGGFTRILHECFSKDSPNWLILIASSRPEHRIKNKIKNNDDKIVEIQPKNENNQNDLLFFIKKRMEKHLIKADEAIIQALVERSKGVFLWLSFQEKVIQEVVKRKGSFTLNDINDLPNGIEETYRIYFQRLYERLQTIYSNKDEEYIQNHYQMIIGLALIVPRSPIPESIWKSGLGFGENSLSDQKNYAQLKDVCSNLLIFSNDACLQAPHKSMIDWLCGGRGGGGEEGESDTTKSAIDMEEFHLAVDKISVRENHLKLLDLFDKMYASVDPLLVYEFPLTSRELTKEEHFMFANVLYHCCEGKSVEKVNDWLLDVNHLYWLSFESRFDYQRLIYDLIQVETHLEPKLFFITNLFRLSQNTLMKDPRQLVGQIKGRTLMSVSDDRLRLDQTCELWLQRKPKNSWVCCVPAHVSTSGLARCDANLQNIFEGHTDEVNTMCLSNDGKTLFTCSRDCTARSWNVETGKQIHVFEGHTFDVNLIRLSADETVLFASSRDTIRSWNVKTGLEMHVFNGHTAEITSMCVSKDNKTLFSGSADRTARVWNAEIGFFQLHTLAEHTGSVNSICLSNDEETLFTCSNDGTARSWDVKNGLQIHEFNGHFGLIRSICLSKDDKTLFTCSVDGTARSWNVVTGQQIHVFIGHILGVHSICLSQNGKILFTCSDDKTVRCWNVETGQQIQVVFEGHTNVIKTICLSNDEKTLFTCSDDETVRSWNVETGQQINLVRIQKTNSFCISKDGKTFFTCSPDTTARSWIWNSENPSSLEDHWKEIIFICLSRNETNLFTLSKDGTVRVFNVLNGQQIQLFEECSNEITSICVSNDGKTLFTCSRDCTIRSWNIETGKQIYSFEGHSSPINRTCLSFDGKTLFTCSTDKTARSWNVDTGKQIHGFEGHTLNVKSICLSKNGKMLFTCSRDKTARSWNVETGQHIQTFIGHISDVNVICVSNDDKTLFTSGSYEFTSRSWNIETGQHINSFIGHTLNVKSMCLSNDDKILFTCSYDKTVRSWNVESGQQIHIFHFRFNEIYLSSDIGSLCMLGADDSCRQFFNVSSAVELEVLENLSFDLKKFTNIYRTTRNLIYGVHQNRVFLWKSY